jgi:hypothetical protein
MLCGYHNKITVRKKDGTQFDIVRCADSGCVNFTKEVSDEHCAKCPRHIEAERLAVKLAAVKCAEGRVPKTPGVLRRALTYAEAVTGWVAAGRPERTDEETVTIFHKYCSSSPPCSWFDSVKQVCKGCGCNVNASGPAVLNKIKMATQHCPRGLW